MASFTEGSELRAAIFSKNFTSHRFSDPITMQWQSGYNLKDIYISDEIYYTYMHVLSISIYN